MNIGFGYLAAQNFTAGSNNIFLGTQTNSLQAGDYNVFIGSSIISPSTTLNNNIILADGQGNIKYRWNGTANTITGTLVVSSASITNAWQLRDVVGVPSFSGLYANVTPSGSNYALANDGSGNTFINGTSSVYTSVSAVNVARYTLSTEIHTPFASSSGVTAPYQFTLPNSTGATASTESIGFDWTSGSLQHATGNITTQRDYYIRSRTHSAVGASTITLLPTFQADAPTAGSNVVITNPVAIRANGNLDVVGTASFPNSGAAAVVGNAALSSGTVTVNTTAVKANSYIVLTRKTSGGTIGTAITYTINAGTSFTITSDNVLDTSTFTWFIVNGL
jgi:hypothetical protein